MEAVMRVERVDGSHRIVGDVSSGDVELANAFLSHLEVRAFSPLTVRTYAFHVLSILRFGAERELSLAAQRDRIPSATVLLRSKRWAGPPTYWSTTLPALSCPAPCSLR